MLHLTTLVRLQGMEWICETSKACAVSGMFWRNAILAMLERGRIALWGSIYLTERSCDFIFSSFYIKKYIFKSTNSAKNFLSLESSLC